ncbi:S41 family peptidase [Emcibacter nanhaiensis]|uniref:S41 family peptidase n=1 Tax=Emcibacter nanhaiensis TaxID=1505037 RepID=A0A501PB58_9PROT|nr:S41 family peptidase [Emcibacter nanhaiensis]TPD57277.1 S41 family peptidase [Emcibacter nanhaiensis]
MMTSSLFRTFLILLVGCLVQNQAHAAAKIDVTALTERISEIVRAQFVDEQVAHKTADEFLEKAQSGAYSAVSGPEDLASQLTDDLRAISGDTHIGVVYDPNSVARYRAREAAKQIVAAKERDSANRRAKIAEAKLDNFGIRAVEVMKGGVGYLRIDYFDGHVDESAPVFTAVMDLLASSRAIILDLRRNGGGNSRILPLFLGYFLGPEQVHFATRQERWNGNTEKLLSRADVKGARHFDKPIYILTSGTTYSLAEHVTYHLRAFGRATVIGERTYGGGNGWDPVVLDDQFYLRIPRISFTNAHTGTLYTEGEGITPDIAVNAAQARHRAYAVALEQLHSTTSDPQTLEEIEWAQRLIQQQGEDTSPVRPDDLPSLGTFGQFNFKGTADDLWLSYRDLPFVKLEKIGPGLYLDDRSIQQQILFPDPEITDSASLTVMRYGEASRQITRDPD